MQLALGVHEEAKPATTMSTYPGADWGREFVAKKNGGALPTSTTTDQLIGMVLAKVTPWIKLDGGCVVSLKLNPTQMAKGVWDDRLIALAKALAGLNVIVVLWHEPEDDFTAAVFAPGFAAGRAALKQGCPDLIVALCSMAYQYRPGGKAAKDAAAWAAIEADMWLVDVYFGESFPATATLATHAGFVGWLAIMITGRTRRWGIAEYGREAGDVRAGLIARDGDWLATDPVGKTCLMILFWGTSGTEDNADWLWDAAARLAIAVLIARLYVPRGYEHGPVNGTLIHLATGVLVAADRTAAWDAHVSERTPA